MILIYVLYLLSGVIKSILSFYGINTFIDITVVIAVVLIVDIAKDYFLYRNKYKINLNVIISISLLLFFYAWLCVSIIYSPSELYSIKKSILFSTNIVAFIYPVLKQNFKIKIFLKYFIIATLIASVWFIPVMLTYVNNWALLLQDKFLNISGLYLTLDVYMGICLIILIIEKSIFEKNIIRFTLIVLMLFILIFLGARGPILFFVISIIASLLIYSLLSFAKRKQIKYNNLLIAIFSIFFLSLITIFIFIKYGNETQILLERSLYRLSLLFSDDKGASVNERFDHYIFSLNHIFNNLNNFVFGHGIGSYGILKLGEDIKDHPHNFILEIFFEIGLIGLLLIIFFFIVVFYRKKQFSSFNFIYFVLFYLFLNIMKSGSLVDHRVFFGFLAILQLIRLRNENMLSDISS